MAALPTMAKIMIVQGLACYEAPSRIAALVKQDFGIIVTRQQISAYNPENTMAEKLSKKWVDLFNATRARFQNEISDIPIANKAYRLRMLDRMANRAEEVKNYGLTAQLLGQAAKECGDAYTNKIKVETTGKDGGPIRTETTNLTAEEAGEAYRRFMG